jgi:hypothetical protein
MLLPFSAAARAASRHFDCPHPGDWNMGYDPEEADEDVLLKKSNKLTVERRIYRIFLRVSGSFSPLYK